MVLRGQEPGLKPEKIDVSIISQVTLYIKNNILSPLWLLCFDLYKSVIRPLD